jgi:hypothetical protein
MWRMAWRTAAPHFATADAKSIVCSATSHPSTHPNQRAFFAWSANAAKTRAAATAGGVR